MLNGSVSGSEYHPVTEHKIVIYNDHFIFSRKLLKVIRYYS